MSVVLKPKKRAATAERHAEQCREVKARKGPVRWILAGDSFFDRWLWRPEPEFEEIRKLLGPDVVVFAKGGDTIENLAWRMIEILDPEMFPFPSLNGVILMIGLNNLKEKDAALTPEKIMCIVGQICARFPALPVYVIALPETPLGKAKGWNTDEMNSRIQRLCSECSELPNVVYTFPWTGIEPGHFEDDGLHLNGAGNDIFFDSIAKIMNIPQA